MRNQLTVKTNDQANASLYKIFTASFDHAVKVSFRTKTDVQPLYTLIVKHATVRAYGNVLLKAHFEIELNKVNNEWQVVEFGFINLTSDSGYGLKTLYTAILSQLKAECVANNWPLHDNMCVVFE